MTENLRDESAAMDTGFCSLHFVYTVVTNKQMPV